ncbi:FtsJ-like methyltransferase [Rhizoctonia solani]|uniref:FtsJ-like methyltransferase n=1 Tax=Rhizoctonia solani TaxID=456999 RepID=A0A8H7H9B7_9AGAM|nr:FtsJ-like methyltransferase [Rhizoctonia solani]
MSQSLLDSPTWESAEVEPKSKWLGDALMQREDCRILCLLNEIRSMGWSSNTVDRHFREQRFNSDHVKHENTDLNWCKIMYDSLQYMDLANGRFVRTERFLDLGSNPGGYASYILRTCPYATGVGISLPIEDAGHGCAIPAPLRSRINIHELDLTLIDLAPTKPKPGTSHISGSRALALHLSPFPFRPHEFDFIVCDAHHLRLHPDNAIRAWNWNRILISQILLALRAVQPGGTIFLKLSCVERALTARILIAFTRIAGYTHTVKSKLLHRKRGSFYLLSKGIKTHTSAYRLLVDGLQNLWYIMTFGGPQGFGRDMTWDEQDLITSWDEVMKPAGVNHIARLGKPMWNIQYYALLKFLKEQGVIYDDSDCDDSA